MGIKLTTAEFIERAKKAHGDKYDYSKTVYTSNKKSLIVTCNKHGDIGVIPRNFLHTGGCRFCRDEYLRRTCKKTTEDFVKQARGVHEERYDYSKVDYKSNRDKVEIICHHHGAFWQSPTNHLRGSNCPKCASDSKLSDTRRGLCLYSASGYAEFCREANKIPEIYLMEIKSKTEFFYKIGLSVNVYARAKRIESKSEYKVSSLSSICALPDCARKIEINLHTLCKPFRYTPKNFFHGHTECFSELTKEVKDFFGI